MPILNELLGFRDEDDFRQRFLIPLLSRLGFSMLVDYHGKREFGVDLLFAEIDRFSHPRYYGLQAKFVASIGKQSAHDLIRDCKEAFAVDFRHPQTSHNQKISSFYGVTAGSISDEARDLFFATLRPNYADNVRLLSGKDLLALDRSSAMSRTENARDMLMGLLIETNYNERVLSQVLPELERIALSDGQNVQYPSLRLRLNALSSYLRCPFLVQQIPVQIIERFWAMSTAFNRTIDKVGSSPLHTVVSIKIPAIEALQLKSELVSDVQAINQTINGVLSQLGPLVTP
ncbi:MAG: hypothetical protein ACLQDI_08930 [Syntrophobacteraceae bacterium]